MDPDECLKEIRELMKALRGEENDDCGRDCGGSIAALAGELSDKVEALDTWLQGGGFLPRDWSFSAVVKVPAKEP